ncbi:hypothetical protein H0X10_01040 [Candidatus Saccharibacteria bacterium]|nr:hypothetical protein [Candidatus Saccharibacteria bacterium]
MKDADQSIKLYKQLLTLSSHIKDNFLKNVPTFENQLSYDEINRVCYKKMYAEIADREGVRPLPELYGEIDGLKELYSRARKYYLTPRNKSVKGLDVQLGNKFDEAMIDFLNKLGIKASRADTKNKRLPDIMILDRTRNIKAYIEMKYHNAPFMLAWNLLGREPYEGSITMDTKKLEKQLIEIESELERPVYFVHWVDFPDLKGIFFNTNEQIRMYLEEDSEQFVRKDRDGDFKETIYAIRKKVGYSEKFYPPLHEMGDFSELLNNLKK